MILRSITSRLVFFYCVLLVILGGAFLLFTVVSFHNFMQGSITDSLAVRTQEIWNTSQGLLDTPTRLSGVIERRFAPQSQERFVRIRRGDRVIYRSGEPIEHNFSAAAVPLTPTQSRPRVSTIGDLLLYTASFPDTDGSAITIDTGQSVKLTHTVQQRLALSLSIGLPILLLAAAIAGIILMRRALTPVEVMINAAESYTFNDPHNRLPLVGTEPRIEALGLALNRMLDRLDNAYSHVSRFSADAAHELRTPLTIIRGELELAATHSRPPPDLERAIINSLEEMTRLSGIVDSLITLSRMDSLWGKQVHATVDLNLLARETIEQMALLAEEKRIMITAPEPYPVMVSGDRDRLKQVMVNLIDNAIKYTPAGGAVTVTAKAEGEQGVMTVADNGIGIHPDHHEQVFERFYRVSPERGENGAGLGLAIVRSICHAHGGQVNLRSAAQAGSIFRVELPLAGRGEYKKTAVKTTAVLSSDK